MRKSMIILLIMVIITAYFANGLLDAVAEQQAKDEMRLAIDAVIKGYGHGAVKVTGWNPRGYGVLQIRIKEPLTTGTDAWCRTSALLFHKLCSLHKNLLLVVESEDGFVPSKVNPMTLMWTRELVRDGLY